MDLRPLQIFLLLKCGIKFDVYRRQILTTKADPRTVRVKSQGEEKCEACHSHLT